MKKPESLYGILYVFAHHIKKTLKEGKQVWPFLRQLPYFIYYNLGNKTPLDRELPWITIGAIHEIKKNLNPKTWVFEYGSGGSTLFFAKQVKEVVSVEHHPEWHEIVKRKLAEKEYGNVDLYLAPPAKPAMNGMVRCPSIWKKEYSGQDFYPYVHIIDQYPDEYFDLILIDGRARPQCLETCIPKLKQGGLLVFDNADREIYQKAIHQNLGKWPKSNYFGPDVGSLRFSETNIYYKPFL